MIAVDVPMSHLRPFFPSADDFAAAVAPHFDFLIEEFGYAAPITTGHDVGSFDVRYDGKRTSLLLTWDAEGGFFAAHLVPRRLTGDLDPDPDLWLSTSEVLAARGAADAAVTQADFEGVDERGFARVMERVADNVHRYCADVLRGDWSVFRQARHWFEEHPEAMP